MTNGLVGGEIAVAATGSSVELSRSKTDGVPKAMATTMTPNNRIRWITLPLFAGSLNDAGHSNGLALAAVPPWPVAVIPRARAIGHRDEALAA